MKGGLITLILALFISGCLLSAEVLSAVYEYQIAYRIDN